MIKCIALDLDGTLLNHENKISEVNLASIKRAQSKGIEVIVATGRNYPDVKEIFKETGLNTWIIAANGATIHDPNGKLFNQVAMEKPKALELLKWLEENDYYYEVFSDDYIYTPQKGRELISIELDRLATANPNIDIEELTKYAATQFGQTGFHFIQSYKKIEDPAINVYNILAFSFDQQKLATGWEIFKNDKSITLVTSGKYNFEFEHIDASKGKSLTKLTKELGIDLASTIAMGDSMNDLSMLSIVGYPIAMGNAREDVKAICMDIAETNDRNGVGNTINRMITKFEMAN